MKKKPLAIAKTITIAQPDDCCALGFCENNNKNSNYALQPKLTTSSLYSSSRLFQFLKNIKALYAMALGIEILCISAAEIGENSGLYLFGFNLIGIPIAYAMGYGLAGFTTFVAILGRYNYGSNRKIDSCCSVLEQGAGLGFIPNLKITFKNFIIGITKLPHLHKQPNLKYILKSSTYMLVTAESAYILIVETVDHHILSVFYLTSQSSSAIIWRFYGSCTRSIYRKIKQKAV